MTSIRRLLRRALAPAHVIDVFVYVVVLNLAVEYVPSVISETFTLSLLTALLLKLVLEAVVAVKNVLKGRLRAATTVPGRILAGGMLWLLVVGSKFVMLELIALVFGSSVSLGGFWSVTGLILVLLLSRAGVRLLLRSDDRAASSTGGITLADADVTG